MIPDRPGISPCAEASADKEAKRGEDLKRSARHQWRVRKHVLMGSRQALKEVQEALALNLSGFETFIELLTVIFTQITSNLKPKCG